MNPEVLVNCMYGGYGLNPPQILDWVQPWNEHAEYYPTISLVDPKEKDQAHIRVELKSCKFAQYMFQVFMHMHKIIVDR